MSLVSNTINAIPGNFGQVANSQSEYDLSDNTFSNLLDKQMKSVSENNLNEQFGSFYQLAGIDGFDIQDLITSANQKKVESSGITIDDEIGTSEMVAFLSKPFDSHSANEHNSNLMNFAKKQVANFYNKCASNVVTDLKEFVEDAIKLS